MVQLGTVDINGVGTVRTEQLWTAQPVVDDYMNNLEVMHELLYKDPLRVSESDVTNLEQALSNLALLSKNGLVVDGQTWRITTDMASQLDLIVRSLKAAGNGPSITVDGIKRWQDLGVDGVDAAMQRAEFSIQANRSMTAMVQLDYIKTANDVFSAQMNSLYEAQNATQKTLTLLSQLSELRNGVTVVGSTTTFDYPPPLKPGDFNDNIADPAIYDAIQGLRFPSPYNESPFAAGKLLTDVYDIKQPSDISSSKWNNGYQFGPPMEKVLGESFATTAKSEILTATEVPQLSWIYASSSELDSILTNYQKDASTQIPTAVNYGKSTAADVLKRFDSIRNDLANQLAVLDQLTPPVGGKRDPYNLAGTVAQVLADMNTANIPSPATQKPFETWIIDGHTGTDTSKVGTYSLNIDKAIAAASTLNSSQQDSFKTFMSIFEQYYESAAAVLQQTAQVIKKIGQNTRG